MRSLRVVDGGIFLESDGWSGAAKAVYVAAGVWTDRLLAASGLPLVGVTPLGGSAAIFDKPWEGNPLWIQTNPYQHVAVRSWPENKTRVCATVENTPESTPTRRQALLAAARRHADLLGQPSWEYGLRPVLKSGPSVLPSEASQRLLVGTGGGRIGAIDGFRAAQQAYQHFERHAWKD